MKDQAYGYLLTDIKKAYDTAIKSNGNYAVISLNIKKFRYMKYSYGDKAVERILKEFMQILSECLDNCDTFIREYQDNFVILKKYNTKYQLEKEWLYHFIDELFEIKEPFVHHNIYTSFGFYLINDRTTSFEEAYEKARFARLFSTSINRRVFSYEFYEEAMLEKYVYRAWLEEKTAKAKEHKLYQIYIQPKVDIKSGRIIGGETLLRLFQEGKMIPVSEFLPLLNENGYIRLIDLDICDRVVKHMKERIQQGKPNVQISFNISNSHFFDEELINDYQSIVEKHKIDPNLIELEFMESIQIDEAQLQKHIQTFHEIGFSCALDDFGNGFSNFELLCSSDVDTVKLDRIFFTMEPNKKNREILKTIIHLLKVIGVRIVAEGVEREEDVHFLKENDCDIIQGFYYYQPMPMDAFFALLDQQEKL